MVRQLSATQLRIMKTIKAGKRPLSGARGLSQHGGWGRSLGSLIGLVRTIYDEPGWELTEDGETILAGQPGMLERMKRLDEAVGGD